MTTNATPTPRIKLNHAEIAALTVAFGKGGIDAACALRPDIPRADLEKKLRSLGVLVASPEEHDLAVQITADVRGTTYPWITAEHVIERMREVIAEHEKELLAPPAHGHAAKGAHP